MNLTDFTFLGWFLLAAAAGFVLWDMAAVWAALRVSALAERDTAVMLAVDEDEHDGQAITSPSRPADGDDYTYPQRAERLYDVRTYDQRMDERIDALEDDILQLEDAVRQLAKRLEELENRP